MTYDDGSTLSSLSSVPVVGCRNRLPHGRLLHRESIKRSGGGVSERRHCKLLPGSRVYQAFRWWGVGTCHRQPLQKPTSLSSVPVVGCRNPLRSLLLLHLESIKRSGGGVSELRPWLACRLWRVYQAFRWWGVGTPRMHSVTARTSLSSVPVVGCRNRPGPLCMDTCESIKRSGGGVSEPGMTGNRATHRVYQAFRWWGVGTCPCSHHAASTSLSSVPVVGCRNPIVRWNRYRSESIKRSGGGVSELDAGLIKGNE